MSFLRNIIVKLTKLDRAYVSEADQFLQRFDRENPKHSDSQAQEVAKHRDIFNRKRDHRIKW